MIRPATIADVPAMLGIYTPYVIDTSITFDYEPPTEEAFTGKYLRISAHYPWLVYEEDSRILGYAYADRAFEKAAYAWCVEATVYFSPGAVGKGRGKALYHALEAELRSRDVVLVYALVTASNETSLRFLSSLGFREIGQLPASGWKLGKWHDVIWLEKRLVPVSVSPVFLRL